MILLYWHKENRSRQIHALLQLIFSLIVEKTSRFLHCSGVTRFVRHIAHLGIAQLSFNSSIKIGFEIYISIQPHQYHNRSIRNILGDPETKKNPHNDTRLKNIPSSKGKVGWLKNGSFGTNKKVTKKIEVVRPRWVKQGPLEKED